MVEDVIDKYHRKKAERLAAEAAETERLRKVAARKASTPWAPEIGQAICDAVADGGVLKDICQTREDLPTLKIVREWIRERPSFAQALKEAERVRLFSLEDELLQAARDASKDRIAKDNGFVPDPTSVARSKLVCDTIVKFLAAHYQQVWGAAATLTVKQPATTRPTISSACRWRCWSNDATPPARRRRTKRSAKCWRRRAPWPSSTKSGASAMCRP